jgi:CBS domain-containing protein
MGTDIVTGEPLVIGPATSVAQVARLMTEHALTSITVADGGMGGWIVSYEDVTRGVRRGRGGLTVSALTADGADPDPSPKLAERAIPEPAASGIESRAPALFEPDTLLSVQYADRVRRRAEFDPERRLMIAVLELGLNDYTKQVGARDAKGQALFDEVEAWIEDRDTGWTFAFQSICDALDLDADYFRHGLRASKERVRGGRLGKAPEEIAETVHAEEVAGHRKAE